MKRNFKEEDMYPIIYNYFTSLGYKVSAEVKDCDVVAIKEDTIIILELKKSLSLDLLVQSVKRQKLGDMTFLVIPKPKFPTRTKYRDMMHLLSRLSLGLIYVSDDLNELTLALEPKELDLKRVRRINKAKVMNLKEEISLRKTNLNKGGQSGRTIMTAYREDCIKLLYILKELKTIAPRQGKALGIIKSQAILRDNYYGWFKKVSRGLYELTDLGLSDLNNYQSIISTLMEDIKPKLETMIISINERVK